MESYQPDQTYDWNYDHPPAPIAQRIPKLKHETSALGWKLASPLGIAAGPLLNGAWIRYYASLGFDMLTYKTVRSTERACYDGPNLLPVECGQLTGHESDVAESTTMRGSWAVSFGMPSKHPDTWRADVEQTRNRLDAGKVLSVSVVGTEQPGWSIDDLAADYAKCARWAVESGADCVETNLSCPNVSSTDGQIYQQAAQARTIVQSVRESIPSIPFIIKIGHFVESEYAHALVESVAPFVNAIATTNSVATRVRDVHGSLRFDGQKRGICGAATRDASIQQTRELRQIIERQNATIELIGVGGIQTAEHVQQYLAAGASCVHLASEAMLNPLVAIEIRRDLADFA